MPPPRTTVRDHGDEARPRPASLLVIGEGTVRTVVLDGELVTIGRDPDCSVAIPHGKLSRRHAVVRLGPPVTVEDLDSTNGTRIGGEVRRGGGPTPLGDEGSFQIGPFSFVLVERAQLAASARPDHDALLVDDPTAEPAPPFLRDFAVAGLGVLVLGETGAGKEVLAQRLHALSGRRGPMVAINCAALSEALLESELFGYEQGAFTGATRAKAGLLEAARDGTVFLDEIGELPPALQPKLLRAIEAREILRVGGVKPIAIDVRFIAATHRELGAEVAAGRFRRDLFFRLDGVTLRLVPLRERPQSIVPLAMQFLAAARRAAGDDRPPAVTPAFLAGLAAHAWPGNVRELKSVCERAAVLARGAAIDARHLMLAAATTPGPSPPEGAPIAAAAPTPAPPAPPGELTAAQQRERERIVAALDACAGNQRRAAATLGMSRATLATRLVLYRIPRPRDR